MSKEILSGYIEEIDYNFDRLSSEFRPGHHSSVVVGGGFHVKGYDDIFNRPDFVNVDWNTTAVTGSKIPLVRILEQKSALTIICLVDISASMDFDGVVRKMHELAKFVASIGFSAYKLGDLFGLLAYGEKVREYFEPITSRTYSLDIGEWLWGITPFDKNSEGVAQALEYLPRKSLLVFWLSDFMIDLESVKGFLTESADLCDIVPLVFVDSAEFERMPRWGVGWLKDRETSEVRAEFFTPAKRRNVSDAFADHYAKLAKLFRSFDVTPLFVFNELKPSEIAEFFLKRRT